MYSRKGFTIVELLIVVVVIAILAAITIVAYNGIRSRAVVSSLKEELSQLARKVEVYKVQSGGAESYPVDVATSGYVGGSGNVITYSANNTASPRQYCADAKSGSDTYYITQASGVPQAGSCSIMTGLRGWWRMNGDATDSSGNGYSGTVTGATLAPGQSGASNTGYYFNPSNAARISLPTSVALTGNPNYTISAWFRTGSVGAWGILGWGAWGTTNASIALRTSIQPGFQTYWWSNDFNTPFSGIGDDQWHQVVTLYDGVVTKAYVDGVYINERAPATGHNAVANDVNIGRTYNTEYFNGWLDDVRLYSRALSPEEISILFAAGAQ